MMLKRVLVDPIKRVTVATVAGAVEGGLSGATFGVMEDINQGNIFLTNAAAYAAKGAAVGATVGAVGGVMLEVADGIDTVTTTVADTATAVGNKVADGFVAVRYRVGL